MTPANKASFTHVRDLTAYYSLQALGQVIVPWALDEFYGYTCNGLSVEEAFLHVVARIDNPAMSKEFHRLTYDYSVSHHAAWAHVLGDSKFAIDSKRVLSMGAKKLLEEARKIMHLLNIQHDDAVQSIPPLAIHRFALYGIAFKSSDPCDLMRRVVQARSQSRTDAQMLHEGAVRKLSRFFMMLLCEVADPQTNRDDNTVTVDDIVRECISMGRDLRPVWVVMAINPYNHYRVVTDLSLRENTVAYITFKGETSARRVITESKMRSRSPTRIFTALPEAEQYADQIRLRMGMEPNVHQMWVYEVELDDGTILIVQFDGRPKVKWGDARRAERKLTQCEKNDTHLVLWPQLSEDAIGIEHIVVGVKQAVPSRKVRYPYDPDDYPERNRAGIPFGEDDYRPATKQDAIRFRALCRERLWHHPCFHEIKLEDNEGSKDRSKYFWNVTILGVFLKDGIGYGVEHQFDTGESRYSTKSSTGDEGHKYRRHMQNQRDLRVMYGIALTVEEHKQWKKYITTECRKKELD